MSNVTKKERLELNALSKEVFGSESRWKKVVEKGYEELHTEEVTETVPPAKEGDEPTTRTVQVPILNNGSREFVTKYHTVESIRAYMLDAKAQRVKIMEQIQRMQEEQRAKQEEEKKKKEEQERANQLHGQSAGSAV